MFDVAFMDIFKLYFYFLNFYQMLKLLLNYYYYFNLTVINLTNNIEVMQNSGAESIRIALKN